MTHFWAKTTSDGNPGISVYDHMVNVGCVARCIAKASPKILERFHLQSSAVGALAALHDLGKISPGFQRKCEVWLEENNLAKIDRNWRWDSAMESDHGKVSHAAIQAFLSETGIDRNTAKFISAVLGAHHGRLTPPNDRGYRPQKLISDSASQIDWCGEAGVRLYASGQPGGARADRLLYQAKLALDDDARLKVVRKMYSLRFKEEAPERRSVQQLRGIEGVRVRKMYELLARQYNVSWKHRNYDYNEWESGDIPNRCLSSATACLYGICEAAILAAGYAPAIGFIHTGKPQSFVYDIADLFKFETVVPIAFRIAAKKPLNAERDVRLACREVFRQSRLLHRIIPTIEEVLAAGGLKMPETPGESVEPAIPNKEGIGDAGHRG